MCSDIHRRDWSISQPDVFPTGELLDRLPVSGAPYGERRLLIAILQDAIYCYQRYAFATKWPARRLFRQAERWFNQADVGIVSFEYVCEVLDLDPDYIRRGLRRWLAHGTPSTAAVTLHTALRRSVLSQPKAQPLSGKKASS